MNTEEKAKAYDKAIERAKAFNKRWQCIQAIDSELALKELKEIFPELKESEDERIRKGIKSILEHHKESGEVVCPYPFVSIDEALAWFEKQREKKIDPRYSIFDKLIEADNIYQMSVNDAMITEARNKAIEALSKLEISKLLGLKKQGEQKNKINSYKITFEDVLALECAMKTVKITKGGDKLYEMLVRLYDKIHNAHPATKEQRDALFAKMKEAEYKWDTKKKELKKIDNEEVNGEDYGIDGLWHAQRILENTLGSVYGYQTDDGILDHKAAITAVKKLYEQKPTWSEEDEHRAKDTIYFLDTAKKHYASTVELDACIDWLKLLKGRVQPKQEWSEEDEKRMKNILSVLDAQVCWDGATGKKGNPYQKEIDWLKSLKNKK